MRELSLGLLVPGGGQDIENQPAQWAALHDPVGRAVLGAQARVQLEVLAVLRVEALHGLDHLQIRPPDARNVQGQANRNP
eukprot:8951690-Alexandrium_andersonii.AAC.1